MDRRHRELLKIGLLANSFEWYEYSIFGFLAGLMGQLFFESTYPIIDLIKGWTLFTTSYLARPLGALFFGLLGHRVGHGKALQFSLLLMAIPTACIGFLPTYSQAGWTGVYLLISLRLIQGFAAGGELPNSGCYVFEMANPQYRSLLSSALVASGPIGMLLGSLVTTLLMHYFTPLELATWAWRLPFLLSIPLTCFIAYIRYTIAKIH
jgi:MHS family proline/betaine transporter-like MFS transporter